MGCPEHGVCDCTQDDPVKNGELEINIGCQILERCFFFFIFCSLFASAKLGVCFRRSFFFIVNPRESPGIYRSNAGSVESQWGGFHQVMSAPSTAAHARHERQDWIDLKGNVLCKAKHDFYASWCFMSKTGGFLMFFECSIMFHPSSIILSEMIPIDKDSTRRLAVSKRADWNIWLFGMMIPNGRDD